MKPTAQCLSNDFVDQLALSERGPVGVELCFGGGDGRIYRLHMHGGNRKTLASLCKIFAPGNDPFPLN